MQPSPGSPPVPEMLAQHVELQVPVTIPTAGIRPEPGSDIRCTSLQNILIPFFKKTTTKRTYVYLDKNKLANRVNKSNLI